MSDQKREVACLRFKGAHYDECALDSCALEELMRFQKIVSEMAKIVWKRRHPGSDRLPKSFDEHTKLVIKRIEVGSTTIPFELMRDNSGQREIFEDHELVDESVSLIYQALKSAENEKLFPKGITKEMLSHLVPLGKKLPDDAEMQLAPPDQEMTPVSSKARQRFAESSGSAYIDELEITGRVLVVDVHRKCFHIWLDDKVNVQVEFSDTQESDVIKALIGYASVQLRVRGCGEYGPDGALKRINNVEWLKIEPAGGDSFDPNVPSIQDVVLDLSKKVPEKAWEKVPTDLSHQHDHYIYGTDKV